MLRDNLLHFRGRDRDSKHSNILLTNRLEALTNSFTFYSYGERGLVRITGILGDLFPSLASIGSSKGGTPSFAPFDSTTFISRVLVPETAILLIKDDLGITSDEAACRVLFASQKFGSALFPDRGEDDNIDSIGVGMRVRLQKGRERYERHISEAERALGTERLTSGASSGSDEDEPAGVLPSIPNKAKGKTKGKRRKKSSSRALSAISSQSSVIDIPSDEDREDDDRAAVILLDDKTPKPRKKIRIGMVNDSQRYSAFSQSTPLIENWKKGKQKAGSSQRSASVTSITSDASR